ncbi:MAG: hypothetical protein Pars93KO_27510 [Parasphingorhabdus sp.]
MQKKKKKENNSYKHIYHFQKKGRGREGKKNWIDANSREKKIKCIDP